MYLPSFPVQGVIPGFTFPLSTVGRLGYITSPPTQPRFSHRGPRYYVPLRLPLPISGRFAFAPFPIPCCCLRLCPAVSGGSTSSRCGSYVARALGFPVPLICRLFPVQGGRRLSQVRELPLYAHAPVVDPGGVPRARLFSPSELLPYTSTTASAFSAFAEYPFGPPSCNYFGVRCRGLHTRFPSASHTPSQGSHFGSATCLLAAL